MSATTSAERYLTTVEAAEYTRFSPETLATWRSRGTGRDSASRPATSGTGCRI